LRISLVSRLTELGGFVCCSGAVADVGGRRFLLWVSVEVGVINLTVDIEVGKYFEYDSNDPSKLLKFKGV
jgi:hypothetical protein